MAISAVNCLQNALLRKRVLCAILAAVAPCAAVAMLRTANAIPHLRFHKRRISNSSVAAAAAANTECIDA